MITCHTCWPSYRPKLKSRTKVLIPSDQLSFSVCLSYSTFTPPKSTSATIRHCQEAGWYSLLRPKHSTPPPAYMHPLQLLCKWPHTSDQSSSIPIFHPFLPTRNTRSYMHAAKAIKEKQTNQARKKKKARRKEKKTARGQRKKDGGKIRKKKKSKDGEEKRRETPPERTTRHFQRKCKTYAYATLFFVPRRNRYRCPILCAQLSSGKGTACLQA